MVVTNAPSVLSVADLAERLEDVLNRVIAGERFAIERDGVPIAVIVPPADPERGTLRELALRLTALPPLDDAFEADVKAARDNLLPPRDVEWPD
jgi:antitoxin (DNA-binding transcriptional repressor) of toxin-antitoxin stability system